MSFLQTSNHKILKKAVCLVGFIFGSCHSSSDTVAKPTSCPDSIGTETHLPDKTISIGKISNHKIPIRYVGLVSGIPKDLEARVFSDEIIDDWEWVDEQTATATMEYGAPKKSDIYLRCNYSENKNDGIGRSTKNTILLIPIFFETKTKCYLSRNEAKQLFIGECKEM